MKDPNTIWTVVMILFVIIFFGTYVTVKDNRRLKAKKHNNTVNLQGVKVGRQKVKCPVELCDYRVGEYCTNKEIDLCMLVKNNYDEYGLYCRGFKSESVVDVKG
jgi:hypothetical protein